MKIFPAILYLVVLLNVFLSSGCLGTAENSNQAANNTVNAANTSQVVTKDDLEDFGKIVKLPFQPAEVSWRETSDKKLIAVLKFSAADAQSLILQIEKLKPAVSAEINAENWFPPELIAKSQQSGDETLKGKEYPANDFFLAPYVKGKITRIDDTNFFILELSSS